jgi:hypothetical protein
VHNLNDNYNATWRHSDRYRGSFYLGDWFLKPKSEWIRHDTPQLSLLDIFTICNTINPNDKENQIDFLRFRLHGVIIINIRQKNHNI